MVQDDSRSTSMNTVTQSLQGGSFLAKGTLLAERFKITELLGHGGQAQVYRAYDQVLATEVALKIVSTGHQLAQSEIDSLRNEVLLARQLSHPNIVRIYEFYQTSDYVFFTMALVSGNSLAAALEQGIKPEQIDYWFKQLLDALQVCHEADIVHGDVKPANIMITADDELVLVDFGIGKHLAEPIQTAGTNEFLAPEVKESGSVSAASDRYAAGKVIDAMLNAMRGDKTPSRLSSWRRRRQHIAIGLQHPLPYQRLSIAACKDLLEAKRSSISNFVIGFTAVVLVLIAGLLSLQWYGDKPADSAADSATTVIAISTEFNDAELLDIAEMTQLSLQIQPSVYALELSQVQRIQNNLAIVPSDSSGDRERLAKLVNSQLLLVLSRRQLDGSNFIHLLITESPGDRVLVNTQFDLANYKLSTLPEVFIEIIMSQLDQGLEPLEYDESVASLFQSMDQALAEDNREKAEQLLAQLKEREVSVFWVLRGEALLAANKGNFEQAKQVLDRLMKSYPNRPDLLAERGALAFATNDLTDAKKFYEQAVAGDPSQAMWWFELAKIKIIQGDIRPALNNELLQALVKFRQSEDAEGQGLVLNAFGVAHLRLAEFSAAADYFSQSLLYRTAELAPAERVTTLSNLATAQAIEGDYLAAEKSLNEAQQLAVGLNDRLGLAHIENERGLLMEEQGFYQEALRYYKTALDIRLQVGESYLQSQSINHVAFIHFLLGDFSLAEVYWRQAVDVLKDMEEVAVLHSTQTNLAQLLVIRGQFQQAEQLLSEILSDNDLSREAEFATYLQLSKLNFAQSRANVAAENISTAVAIAKQITDNRAVTESLLWAAEIAANLHQTEKFNNNLSELEKLVPDFNREQRVYYEWLLIRKSLASDRAGAYDEALAFIGKVLEQPLSRITEAKILSDLVSRFDFPENNGVWPRLEQIISPAMYEAYMAFLSAQDTTSAQQSLLTQLDRYPQYWRNYEYFLELPYDDTKKRASSSLQRFYSRMNDEQRQAYEKFVSSR